MKSRTNFLYAFVLAPISWSAIDSAPPVDTYPRQLGIDAIHYVFNVTLRDDTDSIAATTDVHFRFLHDGVTELFLDLTSISATPH